MKKNLNYMLAVAAVALMMPVQVFAIPVTDPAQIVKILDDLNQNGAAESLEGAHDSLQGAQKSIIGVQNAASKLTEANGLKKAFLGKSGVLKKGFNALGIDYSDPTKAMSNDTLKLLRSELVMPSTEEERQEMTQEAIEKIAKKQAQTFQTTAIQSLAEAWVAQTEASAKAELFSSIGKDIKGAMTQRDILIALVRISAETAAETNARNAIQAGNLTDQSMVALRGSR